MKPIVYPDYSNCILNVTTSILKHYGVKTHHPTLPLVDEQLMKGYRNVVLILIDALGTDAISHHLSKESHLASHLKTTLTSVFPSTTVAATTSVISGKTPRESGWLGWHQYVSEVDDSIVLFQNKSYYHPEKTYDFNIASHVIPYTSIYNQIEKANKHIQTHEVFPAFRTPENNTFEKLCNAVSQIFDTNGHHFVYAYWDKVDSYMHEFGPYSNEVHEHILEVDSAFGKFIESLDDDTLVMVIADHGQIDVEGIPLYEYQDVMDTLIRNPSNESRASVFYVKDDKKTTFETLFNQYFRDHFVLYKSEDAAKMGLFGSGKSHPRFKEFLGDYIAIATDHYFLSTQKTGFVMKGQHAGLLMEEMLVPLIIYSKK